MSERAVRRVTGWKETGRMIKRDAFKVLSRQFSVTSYCFGLPSWLSWLLPPAPNSAVHQHTFIQNNITTVFQILLHVSTFECKEQGFRVRRAAHICHQAALWLRLTEINVTCFTERAADSWMQHLSGNRVKGRSWPRRCSACEFCLIRIMWITWSSHVCSLILSLWRMKARSVREKEVGMCLLWLSYI